MTTANLWYDLGYDLRKKNVNVLILSLDLSQILSSKLFIGLPVIFSCTH